MLNHRPWVLIAIALAGVTGAAGQSAPGKTGPGLKELLPAVEELQRAIDTEDLKLATSAVGKLEEAMRQRQAADTQADINRMLTEMESILSAPVAQRERRVGFTAVNLAHNERWDTARACAKDALSLATPGAMHAAQNRYYGNHALGLVALQDGDRVGAASFLLASAATTTWPGLSRNGPSLRLAQRLLEVGERAVVIEFLERCKTLWPDGRKKLEQWQAVIRLGSQPEWPDDRRSRLEVPLP